MVSSAIRVDRFGFGPADDLHLYHPPTLDLQSATGFILRPRLDQTHTLALGIEDGRIWNRDPRLDRQTTQTVFHTSAGPGLVQRGARKVVHLTRGEGAATRMLSFIEVVGTKIGL